MPQNPHYRRLREGRPVPARSVGSLIAANVTLGDPSVGWHPVDTGAGAFTVTLGDGVAVEGPPITILDATANAGTNNITIDGGGRTINGSTSTTISNNNEALQLLYLPETDEYRAIGRFSGGGTL